MNQENWTKGPLYISLPLLLATRRGLAVESVGNLCGSEALASKSQAIFVRKTLADCMSMGNRTLHNYLISNSLRSAVQKLVTDEEKLDVGIVSILEVRADAARSNQLPTR